MIENPEWLRPSALPKLALCGQYRGDPDGSKYSDRGGKLDVFFREAFQNRSEVNYDLANITQQEHEAVKWAVATARALAGAAHIETHESELRISAMGMTGTADALCAECHWSADLKAGQIRNYREQQAAYALGFMDRFEVDEWTVYLLYCDAEQVDTLRFTREDAIEAIQDALALYHGDVPPQANEYCGWCANRFDCTARREALGILPDFKSIDFTKAESSRLRDFVLAAGVVEDYKDEARKVLLERCLKGEKVAGVSVVANGKKTRTVANEHITGCVADSWSISRGDLAKAIGSLSETKARELLGEQFRDDMVNETHGAAYVTVKQPKK